MYIVDFNVWCICCNKHTRILWKGSYIYYFENHTKNLRSPRYARTVFFVSKLRVDIALTLLSFLFVLGVLQQHKPFLERCTRQVMPTFKDFPGTSY